jgi:outer membrane receptor protein involved in Fe transport
MVKDVIKIVSLLLITTVATAQTITFRTENGWKLDHALLALSKQSGVNIAFNPADADHIILHARSFDKQSLQTIVSTLLEGTKLAFRLQGNRLVVYKTTALPPKPVPTFTRVIVSSRILAEDGTPLPSASIRLRELNQAYTTDPNGNFHIVISGVNTITLDVSYVGYQQQTIRIVQLQNDTILPDIALKEVSLRLKDISVTANRTFEASSNSSLLITREMIEQTPALSLNDLLNQIPNRSMTAPTLQNVQSLNLRGNFRASDDNRSAYELANGFGISIVMDGNTISNNMNMQSYNPGYGGMTGAFVTSPNSWGLKGMGTTNYSGDYTFGGTDLRQIPPDNIESIEVISGVASAKYGDLTDGAVIIERQAGISKGYFRTQLRDRATSASFSKGFRLSDKAGIMNTSFSYVNSNFDSRDKAKGYSRINGNIIWTNFYGRNNRIKNTTIVDYGRNLDGIKRDPDDPATTKTRFDSWNFNVSNKINYRVNGRFLKNVSLNLRYTQGHQYTYREWSVNDAYTLYTTQTTTGIYEGTFATGIYTALGIIDGRPIGMNASLDLSNEFHTGSIIHFLAVGGNYNYGANRGLGQLSDPTKPNVGARNNSTSGGQASSHRYYDYSLIVPQQDYGAYVEDVFKVKIANRNLTVKAGARMDMQNGKLSASPRVNTYYEADKHLRIGLAFGLSYKSPGLAQRYPGPSYREIPLLAAYNGKAAESTSRIYVYRFDPTNDSLKAAKSQTIEFSAQYKKRNWNISTNIYYKLNTDGINTTNDLMPVVLPTYKAEFVTGAKPIVTETGSRRYILNMSRFTNSMKSDNRGIELIISTPKIKAIATSFTIAGGFNASRTENMYPQWSTPNDESYPNLDDYAYAGLYPAHSETTLFSNARVISATHIPKIRLIMQFTAECTLLSKVKSPAYSAIPIAYQNMAGDIVIIDKFNASNPYYGYLLKNNSETSINYAPGPIMNFHMSVGKEIRDKFRLSFNVYNVFNYQPYYKQAGTYKFPNSAPTFGAEFSVKL